MSTTPPPILTSATEAPAAEAATEAPAALPDRGPSSAAAIVDVWFNATFPGTAIGGVTENWNFLHAAKEDLKRRLRAKE
jgi:hypothetical protein